MDFNTALFRFGLDSSNFVNKPINQLEIPGGFIYEVEEECKHKMCLFCNHQNMFVHDYKWIEVKLSSTIGVKECLRIRRIRYRCPTCHKTHCFELNKLKRNETISQFVKTAIVNEFKSLQSFTSIARRYDISTNTVINIF